MERRGSNGNASTATTFVRPLRRFVASVGRGKTRVLSLIALTILAVFIWSPRSRNAITSSIHSRVPEHYIHSILSLQDVSQAKVQPGVNPSADSNDCPQHSPGRVAVDHQKRKYCFGATTLPGPRICDTNAPDFTQPLLGDAEWLKVTVREQDYLVHSMFHMSETTKLATEAKSVASQVTLATQGSWNRIHYLETMAQRWQGPVSVALLLDGPSQLNELTFFVSETPLVTKYVDIHVVLRMPRIVLPVAGCGQPLSTEERNAAIKTGLGASVADITTGDGQYLYKCERTCVGHGPPLDHCRKEMVWCSDIEQYGTLEAQMNSLGAAVNLYSKVHPRCPLRDNHYPVNMLRNVAQQNVFSDWLMALDIDVVPNTCMRNYAKSALQAERYVDEVAAAGNPAMACAGLYAFIPPALEMSTEALDSMKVQIDGTCENVPKSESVRMMMSGAAKPMHMYFPPAYVPTNHAKWMSMTLQEVYEVDYNIRFEPYYIARTPAPMFGWEFVDRGGNFAQQVLDMYAGGYRFFVLPSEFVVDVPHTATGPRQTEDNQKLSNVLWRDFYSSLLPRYGIRSLPSYKGDIYRAMRERLDLMVQEYHKIVKGKSHL